MRKQRSQPVMDVFPWPHGLGFMGSRTWWRYVHRQTEFRKLELLLMTALLSDEIEGLLLAHDLTLFQAFQFSDQTIALLSGITAATVSAFTEALIRHHENMNGMSDHEPYQP